MKQEKCRNRKTGIILAYGISFLLLNLIMDGFHYNNYQDKMKIAASILQEETEDKNAVLTGLLKGDYMQIEEGVAVLERYGYLPAGNFYWREMRRQCIETLFILIVFYTLILLGHYIMRNIYAKKQNVIFEELETCLLRLREKPEEKIYVSEPEILHQMEALQDYFRLIKEQAKIEKEGTKSLVTDISHQLKTPVVALDVCFTALSEKQLSEEERKEFMERCRNELNGLEKLLESLMQISKMESGIIQLRCEEKPLLNTMVNAVNRVYPKASDKEIEIAFENVEEVQDIVIWHDEKWLCEAFINVLDNSIKYSPSGSVIQIRIAERSSFLRIEITDQGIGIPKEEYHKVFQRFYRGSLNEVKQENGSGVGLYLSREIIQMHHGTIAVHSRYGTRNVSYPGSTFIIQLPLTMTGKKR